MLFMVRKLVRFVKKVSVRPILNLNFYQTSEVEIELETAAKPNNDEDSDFCL